MIYRCVNCGGNVVYSPENRRMMCLSCGGFDCQEVVSGEKTTQCPNCNSTIPFSEYGSAGRCPSCGTYVLRDEMVSYPYGADVILPFMLSKRDAEEKLKAEFGRKLFMPGDFLSVKTLEHMRGVYVPFWLFDYQTDVDYNAVGTKVRHWVSGDRRYTETSYFQVYRKLHIDFEGIPVDASLEMNDQIMDLMEPYEYKDLLQHDNKFLSGFESEAYNFTPDQMEPRAVQKAERDTNEWVARSVSGYHTLTSVNKNTHHNRVANRCALLPVWIYEYRYHGKNYQFYVNGQTGKCVGTPPVSIGRAIAMTAGLWACIFAGLEAFALMLGVI